MRKILAIFCLSFFLIGFATSAHAEKRQDAIAVVVGARAVTQSDIQNRVRLILASASLPNTPDVLARVRPQVINMLIEESIKVQEAKRQKITIEAKDIDEAIGKIAEQNKLSAVEFTGMLGTRGIPVRTLRDQIAAQIAWGRVVSRQLRAQAQISEKEIDVELARLSALAGQTEYLLAEIVLYPDRAADAGNISALASRLVGELRAHPERFADVAKQFSRAAGAAQGGMMGWATASQLSDELERAINGAKKDTVLGPIKTPAGTHILLVRDTRTRTAATLPSRDEVANRLGLDRLDRLQRRYYQDLRSATFVEKRV